MTESAFRRALLRAFRTHGVAACAIEDLLDTGVPDIFWRDGALELKTCSGWPAKAEGNVRLCHDLKRSQALWARDWVAGGGQWQMAIYVAGGGVLLFGLSQSVRIGMGAGRPRQYWEDAALMRAQSVDGLVRQLAGRVAQCI